MQILDPFGSIIVIRFLHHFFVWEKVRTFYVPGAFRDAEDVGSAEEYVQLRTKYFRTHLGPYFYTFSTPSFPSPRYYLVSATTFVRTGESKYVFYAGRFSRRRGRRLSVGIPTATYKIFSDPFGSIFFSKRFLVIFGTMTPL